MTQFLRLSDYRRKPSFVHFDRSEFMMLLDLYARRVAAGEWRDYAIDNGPTRAVFAVFRSAHERPLFTIAKLTGNGRNEVYVVASGQRKLRQATSLADALAVLDPAVRQV